MVTGLAQDIKILLKDRTDTSFSLFWGARILQRKTTEIQTRKAPVGYEVGEQGTYHFPETPRKTITGESSLMR